jgi:hypothetical protein
LAEPLVLDAAPTRTRLLSPAAAMILAAGAIVFIVLATMNSSGYRYGAADQAFYIPAIQHHLNPALFPRDLAVLGAHGRYTPFDEIVAAIVRATGMSLPTLFFASYVASLVLVYAALVVLGRHFYASNWTTGALIAAYTLRHRIARTGANTLEGYFHPRILVLALGALALHEVFKRRATRAWLLVALGAPLHPTTALFFAVWVGVALAVNEPRQRRALLAVTAVGAAISVALLARGTLSLAPMASEWLAALTDKDYILPTDWGFQIWALNFISPLIIVGAFQLRRRNGLALQGELGIVTGCLALVAMFLASWPLLIWRSTLAVQLQLSRIFWLTDLLATIYAVWLFAEAGTSAGAGATRTAAGAVRRAQIVMVAVLILAASRGWYTLRHDHPGRPLIEIGLPADEWTDVGRWIQTHTPPDAALLADPGHAWRFGTSLRVSAERDVFIEDVKDIALGMYDRGIAARNMERRAAIGDFFSLTPAQMQTLAARYDLEYLVTDRDMPLVEVYRNARFHVYRLK